MINKLKSKIFFLIMISLLTITLGIIIIFTYYNYRNTINTSTFFMDRVFGLKERDAHIDETTSKNLVKPDLKFQSIEEDKDENQVEFEERDLPEIEGFYLVLIKNSEIMNKETNLTEEIKEYAFEASKRKNESGIIGNFIYKLERQRENEVRVILVENKEAISRIKLLILVAIAISLLAVIIIYIIAKKLSEIIVKPVEETFSKQMQFISDASHELKTPLAVIEANADVLESKQGNSKWLTYIQNEIESMNKLINELLLLAKIENVDTIRGKEEFNISKQVEMTVLMFESMAYEKNVKLETRIQDNLIFLGAKEDVEHIVSTLIDNAIKHVKEKGKVIIELRKEQNNILLLVKNEGDPIKEEERDKIFERFYRVDKSRNREEKRYGLGLAIAKSTVQKYKGTIEVECKNGYTTFKVKIPG